MCPAQISALVQAQDWLQHAQRSVQDDHRARATSRTGQPVQPASSCDSPVTTNRSLEVLPVRLRVPEPNRVSLQQATQRRSELWHGQDVQQGDEGKVLESHALQHPDEVLRRMASNVQHNAGEVRQSATHAAQAAAQAAGNAAELARELLGPAEPSGACTVLPAPRGNAPPSPRVLQPTLASALRAASVSPTACTTSAFARPCSRVRTVHTTRSLSPAQPLQQHHQHDCNGSAAELLDCGKPQSCEIGSAGASYHGCAAAVVHPSSLFLLRASCPAQAHWPSCKLQRCACSRSRCQEWSQFCLLMGLIACRRRQCGHTPDAAMPKTCSVLSSHTMADLAGVVADGSNSEILQDGSMSGKQAGAERAGSILSDNVHEALKSVLEGQ